jgi:hypothetical protein
MRRITIAAFAALTLPLAACGGQVSEEADAETIEAGYDAAESSELNLDEMAGETVEECIARNNPSPSTLDDYQAMCEGQIAFFNGALNGDTYVDGNGNLRSMAEAIERAKSRVR